MNPVIDINIGAADPNASPLTVNELFILLQSVITGSIEGSYIPYVIGHDQPGVDDQDKAWIELDTGGRPLSTKIFYNGNWRRIYNGMKGEIRGYSGDPSQDFDVSSDPTQNGAYTYGKVGGTYDGWHLCNGLDGTPNMVDKFLVGAHMDNSSGHVGYSSGWQTTITNPDTTTTDYKNGGAFIETLSLVNVPTGIADIQFETGGEVNLYRWTASGNTQDDGGPLWGLNNTGATPHHLVDASTPNTTPKPFWTTPPFISVGWIVFLGYI